MKNYRLYLLLFLLITSNAFIVAADNAPLYQQKEFPDFWKSTLNDVDAVVKTINNGEHQIIALSPGGRPVYLVSYGERKEIPSQANYNSAVAARSMDYYAEKPEDVPPIVYLVGPTHGHEVEGIVGLLNLIHVAETGEDFRGKEWPRLQENIKKCRLLIIPLMNPDGRARCPYDCFIGCPAKEMARVGQGTRKDGSNYGWPGAKQRHPMKDDVEFLGAYFNDDGINPMHDEFFDPMAQETKAALDIARDEAPDYIINLHSHGQPPAILKAAYVPWYCKEVQYEFGKKLMERYKQENLPAGSAPEPQVDGEIYPPPSLNFTSALHHVSGAFSMTFECPHGLLEERYPDVTMDDILDIQLILYDEILQFALDTPRPQWEK